MTSKTLIVIGAGPGGYAAALEGARHGMAVTLIEKDMTGGTCLNRGCIPSKFLLAQAKSSPTATAISTLAQRKDALLATLRQRMDQAAKTARVQRVQGTARFVSAQAVEVNGARYEADAFIIATGTTPIHPSIFPKHPSIVDSTGILQMERIPQELVVVGGGYIGSELACAFRGLGSRVTLIEKEKSLLATQPEFEPATAVMSRAFQKKGIAVWTDVEVKSATPLESNWIDVACSNGQTIRADLVLLALGRRPQVQNLGLENAGIHLNGTRIAVNAHFQTNLPHIYAIGDVVSPAPLAHTATREAEVAIAHLAGETKTISYPAIPRCIYTFPEAAAVGRVNPEHSIRYHMAANAKALAEGDSEGFWLITTDPASRQILGALIVGAHATELIHLVALAIQGHLTIDQVADTVFAHPTLAEGFGEAMKRAALQ